MSAAAISAPRSASPERYPTKTPAERARLVRAESQLITRFLNAGLLAVAWRCHVCGGRVDVKGRTVTVGRQQVTKTTGKCRTADCLNWED